MIKPGRALRLARLTKCEERPLFIVPLDHTVTDGPFTDARGYDELLVNLAKNGVDAIVVHKGRLGLLPADVYAKLSVIVHISASTKYAADPTFKYQVGDVEDCLRRGADAVSVHVNVGSLTEDRQLSLMGQVADACDRVGLPLLAMLYPRGPGIKDHAPLETLLHAASLAVDLGADIVKLPLSGTVSVMKRVIDSCPIPVVAAGGSEVSDSEFVAFVADVMKSGARGLAAGRNIFKAADPAAKVCQVRSILHANYPRATQQSAVPIAAWSNHDQDQQVDGAVVPGLQPVHQEKVS
jgi:2-amino-4,5-dihydroxy-6-oxo-7-(phosphonooxy)heptanoate synthase